MVFLFVLFYIHGVEDFTKHKEVLPVIKLLISHVADLCYSAKEKWDNAEDGQKVCQCVCVYEIYLICVLNLRRTTTSICGHIFVPQY